MSTMRKHRVIFFVALIILVASYIGVLVAQAHAQAFDYPKLLNRSLTLGSTIPGETTDYTFSWRYPSNTNVRSIRMLLCADGFVQEPCSGTPAGDFSAAMLSSQSGAVTGFNIVSQTTDEILLTRLTSAAGTGQSTYILDNVVNPTGLHSKFFVQIFTYPTPDATGQPNHISSVASATAEPILINTVVPPILYFCAALSIDEWCENVNGNFIDYGDFAPYVTVYATSQFGVATNALGGYVVTINGDTMTSGNKLITPLDTHAPNSPGVGQFGLNLRANTDPPAGADAFGAGIGTVHPDYDIPDQYLYHDGDVVASAVTGSTFNTYTVTYIVNIDPDQPSGVYNTTIAYVCTAAF